MFKHSFSDYYWLFLFIIVFWVFVFAIVHILRKKLARININLNSKILIYLFAIANSFSLLGLTMGLLIGLSLTSVIGIVIPALLTFFGGFLTYVFVLGNKKALDGYIMVIILSSISFFMIVGVDYGSAMRIEFVEQEQDRIEHRKREFEILKSNLMKENIQFDEGESFQIQYKLMNNNIKEHFLYRRPSIKWLISVLPLLRKLLNHLLRIFIPRIQLKTLLIE